MTNAHSHAFQRVLRGRTEYRTSVSDSFWTWREMMYSAAARLSPEDIYDASRMAFLEMALSGITAVGEFHYLHHAPDGKPYDDPNLLAKEVVRAARDVGLRIALLRVAYARAGYKTQPNPQQARFIEKDPGTYLRNVVRLIGDLNGTSPTVREGSSFHNSGALPDGRAPDTSWVGVGPHSVRAVPLDYLREVIAHAQQNNLKVHMHVAEQPAEVSACVEEYGRTPIALLETEGFLSENFTAVHAIHVTPKAIPALARTGAIVCACPTTERNLGDGVVPAGEYFKHGVPVCLGTDSHAQIDLLEDARELEYHLRLQRLERAVLAGRNPAVREGASILTQDGRNPAVREGAPALTQDGRNPTVREGASALTQDENSTLPDGRVSAIATRLFDCATINGARSIGAGGGALEPGKPGDFFTIDLNDPAIVGASTDDLLSSIVFSLSRAAVREVVVGGKPIVSDGRHLIQEEILEKFNDLQKRLWS